MPEPARKQKAPTPTPSATGETFGKYVLLRRLAVGGMAEVHLAKLEGAAGFNKPVVLKQVLPHLSGDPQFLEMFLDEARLAARLSHPNIAQTFDLGEEEGCYYLAMEYVAGETVAAVQRRAEREKTRVPLQCTLRIVLELLEALEYAHNLTDDEGPLNIVHRDVSPSNVMLTFHGGVKLLDFGIARAATRNHQTAAGIVKGKQGYMAPEQCRPGADIDQRADIFSTGAVLYALVTDQAAFLTGGRPFIDLLRDMETGTFPPPRAVRPEVPIELERIILRAMAPSLADRYPTANAMADDLERFAAAEGLFPGPRQLGEFVRGLFPEKAPLARAMEQMPDAKAVARLIDIVGTQDIVVDPPGAAAEKPTRSELAVTTARTQAPPVTLDAPAATIDSEGPTRDLQAAQPTRLDAEDPATRLSATSGQRRSRWGLGKLGVLGGAMALLLFLAVRAVSGDGEAQPPPAAPKPSPKVAPAVAGPAAPPEVASPVVPREVPEPVRPPAPAPPAVRPPPAPRPARAEPARTPLPKKTGWLVLDSYPWTRVTEEGRSLGTTPLRVELPEGPHQLLLVNEAQGVRKVVRLTVRADRELSHFEKAAAAP